MNARTRVHRDGILKTPFVIRGSVSMQILENIDFFFFMNRLLPFFGFKIKQARNQHEEGSKRMFSSDTSGDFHRTAWRCFP
jgi:hypothetical protein